MTGKETIDILDRIARENNGNKVYGKAENAVAYVFAGEDVQGGGDPGHRMGI